MCDLKVCRICLKNESKYYKLDEYGLRNCYEDVTALPVSSKDGLPQYFCYECASLLHKFHIFKNKCIHGQKILQDMLWSGPITYAGICEINAKRIYKPKYPDLEILTVNDRVKTYNYIYDFNVLKPEEFVADVNYSDGPFSDCDNLQDPEIDPVTDLFTDSVTGEGALVLDNIKIETPPENATDIEDVPEVEETALPLDINEVKSEEEIKTLIEELPITLIEESPIKQKKVVKKKRVVKSGKKKRKRLRPKAKSDTEADSDSSEETLSKIKRRKAISPDTSKTYKFNKPKSGVKNLAFLNSGFWKKASLTEEEALKEFEGRAQDRKYLSAAYKCTDCYKGFSQKEMLDRHIPKRHGQAIGKMVCRFCKTRYKSLYFLNKHMRQHYTKYECLRCDLVCTLENSALFHEEYHNGVVRKCPHCDKEFKHLSTFYTHLRTHRSKHMCAHCGESFVSQLGLRLHKKAKHVNENEQQPAKSMKDNLYCDVCKIKFGTKAAYNKHLAHSAMHTDENLVIDDRFVTNLVKDEEEDYDGNNKTEELLKRRSRVEKTLSAVRKSHLPRQTTKKPTTCHQCGKHFETQSACMKHHLAAHPGTSFFSPKERVICEVCGASLAPGSVASHLNQHTRQRIYTCDTCGRSFTTSTMMRTHLVTHTGEKKFACSLCDKRFTQNGSLSLHYRTFHLKQPYPKRNRRKKPDPHTEGLNGEE